MSIIRMEKIDKVIAKLKNCKSIVFADWDAEIILAAYPDMCVQDYREEVKQKFPTATYVLHANEEDVNELTEATVYLLPKYVDEGIDFNIPGEVVYSSNIDVAPAEPMKPYEDRLFKSTKSMFAVLTPEMDVVAAPELLAELKTARPEIKARPILSGSIFLTGGTVVLLSLRSKVAMKKARQVYPANATLYTVTK